MSANSPEEAREIHAESEYWLKLNHSVLALESDEITEENENVSAVFDAVEKPKTARTGLQLYPWQDVDVGKGFLCPTRRTKSPCAGST